MIIGTCGFTATGSSAVSDYLKEFENLSVLDLTEFVLSYYPDGLEDLDYQLNKNCSKYSASVVAIERFRRHVYNYCINSKVSTEQKREIVKALEEFISAIRQVKWKGCGRADYQLYSSWNYNKKNSYFFYNFFHRVNTFISKKFHKNLDIYPIHDMEFAIRPENFMEQARLFVHKLLEIYGADYNKTIVLDQPFSGNNPGKSFKFFEDPVAIVVDRDPRDCYLFAKKFLRFKGVGRQIPTDSVEDFVEYYRRMRDNQPYKEDCRVLNLCFEDMIYKYDESIDRINNFCGLNPEDRVRRIFAPELSINNTQLFKKYPEYKDDVKYIERELKEYLYPFELFGEIDNSGQMFFGKSPLNH